jgi:hypothetical protein
MVRSSPAADTNWGRKHTRRWGVLMWINASSKFRSKSSRQAAHYTVGKIYVVARRQVRNYRNVADRFEKIARPDLETTVRASGLCRVIGGGHAWPARAD